MGMLKLNSQVLFLRSFFPYRTRAASISENSTVETGVRTRETVSAGEALCGGSRGQSTGEGRLELDRRLNTIWPSPLFVQVRS